MRQRLSYLGNAVLAVACVGLLASHYLRSAAEVREARERSRFQAVQDAEWQTKAVARDEESRRTQAALQARVDALEAETRAIVVFMSEQVRRAAKPKDTGR